MKHVLKSLKHNGIYVPKYVPQEFSIRIQGQTIKLTPKSEQMAVAWVRKRQSAASPPDRVFMKNFMREFLEILKQENPTLQFLGNFTFEYLQKIEGSGDEACNSNSPIHQDIDFSQIITYVEAEKNKKLSLTPEEKKKQAEARKVIRKNLKLIAAAEAVVRF